MPRYGDLVVDESQRAETLYEHAGGDQGLHRVEQIFYDKVLGFDHLIDVHRGPEITDEQRQRFVELYPLHEVPQWEWDPDGEAKS